MVDALAPAVAAYETAGGADLAGCVRAAAGAAEKGAEATVPMQARKGRASYLGPRSTGHLDPGAVSTALILRALADVVRPSGRATVAPPTAVPPTVVPPTPGEIR
jgi:dihydroxyacetone kinase-like protein